MEYLFLLVAAYFTFINISHRVGWLSFKPFMRANIFGMFFLAASTGVNYYHYNSSLKPLVPVIASFQGIELGSRDKDFRVVLEEPHWSEKNGYEIHTCTHNDLYGYRYELHSWVCEAAADILGQRVKVEFSEDNDGSLWRIRILDIENAEVFKSILISKYGEPDKEISGAKEVDNDSVVVNTSIWSISNMQIVYEKLTPEKPRCGWRDVCVRNTASISYVLPFLENKVKNSKKSYKENAL